MLNLELHWKAHPTTKETIIGICPELPDSFCYFYIMRMAKEKFWVAIPSYGTDYVYKRLILRDPVIARQFCQDYLNQNTRSILEHQISEMKRRSAPSIKSQIYYEAFLKERVLRKEEEPPRKPFRKAS